MRIEIKRARDFKTNTWSGGTTTELLIYPLSADYAKRSFDFRLSTATVETETSDFTPLPGISRKLMVLDGEMILHHNGHASQHVRKFDVAVFDGSWRTRSHGRCTDFNLMLQGNRGDLNSHLLAAQEVLHLNIPDHTKHLFVYLWEGKLLAQIQNEKHELDAQDLLVVENPQIDSLQLHSILNSVCILVRVF